MKIAVIGATGMAGQEIYREAVKRGHDVTAVVRNVEKATDMLGAEANLLVKDVFALQYEDLADFDVIVDAFGNHHQSYQNIDAATHLIHIFREQENRVIFLLGAASLHQQDGGRLFDTLKELPHNERWIDEPRYGVLELQILRETPNVNWTGVSPQENFTAGPATGYLLGGEDLIYDESGKSHLHSGNMALAILDEIETPQHIKTRFSVSDKPEEVFGE
jgi:putative NADH-flavin reductase